MTRLYADRDGSALEPHFSQHMDAMTAEGLHSKAAIAAELAYRDAEVERLQALVQQMSEVTTVQACRGCGQYVRPRYMDDRLCARCWRAKVDGYRQECDEVEQALGRALGYPGYPELDSHRVCVGDHAPATIAAEAARKLYHLRALAERQHEALNAVWDCYCSDRVATEPGTVDADVFACLAEPEGQRAAAERAALVAVAKAAKAWRLSDPHDHDADRRLIDALDDLRQCDFNLRACPDAFGAVRGGKEEQDVRI